MKIKGKSIPQPKSILIPIPREGEETIMLTFEPVMNWTHFDTLCPEPNLPTETIPGKATKKVTDEKSPFYKTYLKKVEVYTKRQTDYSIVKGLMATEDLEWDNVDIDKPDTWKNWEKELEGHFTKNECAVILNEIMMAGFPTEERRDEAKRLFTLQQLEEGRVFTSQKDEPNTTPSGEPANV